MERPLSPKKPGEIRKSRRHHVEARQLRADECYATALRVVTPWTIPLRHVFDHYIAISKGFVNGQNRLEDFAEVLTGWSTMQQNEFIMCFTDLGIVPAMITKRRALHLYHSVTSGANSPDTVNFDLFRSIILVVSRQPGVVCQDLPTDQARVNALCSWFRVRCSRAELIYSLFKPDNRDVQLGIKSYSERLGGVVQWEDGSTPECDYTHNFSSRLRKADVLGEGICVCMELLDDLLNKLFGWAARLLMWQQDSEPRPPHAQLGPKMSKKIVEDTMTKYSIDKSNVIRGEMRCMMDVHARRSLSHNVGAIAFLPLYEACLDRAKMIQIKAADNGRLYLEMQKKPAVILPHTKQAIKRLYKPAEPPPKVIISHKVGFGGGVPEDPPNDSARGIQYHPKPKYRFGQATIDKLHVRHIPPAKILISVVSEIVDYIISGKARKKLGAVYGDQYSYTGGRLPATLQEWSTIKKKAPRIGPKAPKPSAEPPKLRPKEKEKHSSAKKRANLQFVAKQKKRDEDRARRKKQLDQMLKRQKKKKADDAKQKWDAEAPLREAEAAKKERNATRIMKREANNKKKIVERNKILGDSKIEAKTKEMNEKKKITEKANLRAQEAHKRQVEKQKKLHDEAVEKAKELGISTEKLKFDETRTSALSSNSDVIRARAEINRKHSVKLEREKTRKEDEVHNTTRENHQEETVARQEIERVLAEQLRFALDDGTKGPFDYVSSGFFFFFLILLLFDVLSIDPLLLLLTY